MYLSDLIIQKNTNINNNLLPQIDQKLIFNANPIINQEPIENNNIVTKGYLYSLFENIFGTSFYENNLNNNLSPISIYTINLTNAECIEGNYLIFELVISPELYANLSLKLELISSTAIAGIDFTNSFFYSEDNKIYTEIQNNIINIKANTNKVYIKIKTEHRDDTEYYGDKILVLKIKEIVLYDSPENPYFVFNDVGIGKIKEVKAKPIVYNLNINNPIVYKGTDVIFELVLNKIITNLTLTYQINNLTAFSEVDYDLINAKYSITNGATWLPVSNSNINFINTDKILLKVPTKDRPTYQGDKVFLLNISGITSSPENSIINIVNSTVYATIRDQYLPTIDSYLNVKDAFCNEGQSLVFETELIMSDADKARLLTTQQIIVYFNVINITAFSGNDYSEVMYWSTDNVNFISTSTRQVIYTNSNLKVFIKFETIDSAAPTINNKKALLLKPEFIINKPENINIKLTDLGIGTINNITIPIEYYDLLLEDSITKEGNDIVFDLFSNKPLTNSIVLNIQLSDLTAYNNIDYLTNTLQYSINQGSTYINAIYNNIIFHKNLTNIKLKVKTIKKSNFNGNRSFLIKIKEILEQPMNYNINYHDMAIGTIEDLDDPPVNYKITIVANNYNVIHGNDFVFEGYVYPPLRYDNLELKLKIISEKAIENTDYSFRFGNFSTNNGLTWNSISQSNTIILNKDTTYFKIKIPTFKNLSSLIIKPLKFEIEKVVYVTPNSNFDITEAYANTNITV